MDLLQTQWDAMRQRPQVEEPQSKEEDFSKLRRAYKMCCFRVQNLKEGKTTKYAAQIKVP